MPQSHQIVSAIRWCAASMAWAALVGVAAVGAGVASSSVALVGFGLDSLVDGGASVALFWRFREEAHGHRPGHEVERQAAGVVAVLLELIALYLIVRASIALADHSSPSASLVGVTVTGASVLVLPVLGLNKLRLSRSLGSQALRADGVLSTAGAALAAATLIGLALSEGLGLWWADSVAALLIAAVLAREGLLTWRSR